MALILEELDARAGVRTRLRLDQLPVHIGRALDNDLVLDDPYVDATHARIVRTDADDIVIEDLGSANGITVAGARARLPQIHARAGVHVTLGRTTLRFRDSAEPVPPALRQDRAGDRVLPRWTTTTLGQGALVLGALAAFAASMWLDSYERSAANDTFSVTLGVVMFCVLWAGAWSIAGRIFVHRFRFLAHYALLSVALLAVTVWGAINTWAMFLFPGSSAIGVINTGISLVTSGALIAGHLGIATQLSARRRWQAGVTTGLLLSALMGVSTLTDDDSFSDVPEYNSTLKAMGSGWVPAHSITDFRAVTVDLQQEVDALLEKQ